uniref:Proline rich 27 n=1 Tax=Rousettus aegyptiacus TaxID=9407 RepID=A0A7J8E9Q6_ROUAE|nr:proline rich 27 [Rousettus aegyptiacus]
MKLLLWACIVCVVFAKKKFLSSNEEVYGDKMYPVNPSLDSHYPISDSDFTSPVYPSENNLPKYPGNPDTDPGTPAYPWIRNAPGAALNHIPSFPVPTWLAAPPRRVFSLVPPSNKPAGPFASSNAVAADPYVAKLHNLPKLSDPEVAVEPTTNEHGEGEPTAATHAAPEPPSSLDLVKK